MPESKPNQLAKEAEIAGIKSQPKVLRESPMPKKTQIFIKDPKPKKQKTKRTNEKNLQKRHKILKLPLTAPWWPPERKKQ